MSAHHAHIHQQFLKKENLLLTFHPPIFIFNLLNSQSSFRYLYVPLVTICARRGVSLPSADMLICISFWREWRISIYSKRHVNDSREEDYGTANKPRSTSVLAMWKKSILFYSNSESVVIYNLP